MFSDILKLLRKRKGLSQTELAQKLGVSKSAISMYEVGERMPDYEMLKTIASIFNVDINYLYGVNEKRPVRIPVYGSVAAGIPVEAITDIEDYEEITEDMARDGKYAALKIKGNSMEPRFTNGDVVIVKLQDTVESGDIAIVMVNGDEATCKKIKKTPEGVMLISTNPAYEPMFYSNKEIEEKPVTIWGKVVELRAKF